MYSITSLGRPAYKGHSPWFRRIALFLGILLSGGMLAFPRIPLFLLLILFAMASSGLKGVLFSYTKKIWIILAVILVVTVIRPGPLEFSSLLIRYANFLGGLLLLVMYLRSGYQSLSNDLFLILPWLSLQAIITFVLANSLPSLFSVISLPEDGSINSFFYIFNFHNFIEDFSGWNRPDGFFWEPGVFQLYINLYLYLALFVFKKNFHVLLALSALACIYSTTGLLITGWLLGAAIFQKFLSGKVRQRLHIVLVTISFIPIFGYILAENFQDKFTGESRGSSMIRQYDLFVGLKIISEYPVLGIGFDNKRYQEIASKYFISEEMDLIETPERSNSNGVVYLGYSLGILLSMIFLWGIFRQKFFPNPWIFGVLIFLSMVGEVLIFTPFILMIIFSAFAQMSPNGYTVRESVRGTEI